MAAQLKVAASSISFARSCEREAYVVLIHWLHGHVQDEHMSKSNAASISSLTLCSYSV